MRSRHKLRKPAPWRQTPLATRGLALSLSLSLSLSLALAWTLVAAMGCQVTGRTPADDSAGNSPTDAHAAQTREIGIGDGLPVLDKQDRPAPETTADEDSDEAKSAEGNESDNSEPQVFDDGGGYGLLYDVLKSQSGVTRLLWFKWENRQVGDAVRDIAGDCEALRLDLEAWAAADPSVVLELPPLPDAETDARAWITKLVARSLLLHSRESFEKRLLLAQNEAVQYIAALCEGLADVEVTKDRQARLEQAAGQMEKHRASVLDMLRVVKE